MRFIITAHPGSDTAAPDPEAAFDEKLFTTYMQFNEEMHRAGVLVAAEGLNPAGKGARVEVKRGRRTVVDGPFAESKETIGGYFLLKVGTMDEAVAIAQQCPGLPHGIRVEVRPVAGECPVAAEARTEAQLAHA